MTLYDAAMVVLIVGGMVWGAWRGITWQIASIASLVLGYMVAHSASDQLAPHFPGDPLVARGLAMLVVYVAVSAGVFGAAWLVRATLRRLKFEAYDRHLGMVLGGLEGALVGMVATLFVVSLAPKSREPIFASPSGKVVGKVMGALGPILPEEARGVLAPFWEGERTWRDATVNDFISDPVPVLRDLKSDLIKDAEARIDEQLQRASGSNGRGRTTERR